MTEARARAMIRAHFDASNVGAAGGAPGDDIARASEIYADDAVLEWPQGERVRGKANIMAFRSTYPARQRFELHRITGCHDLWINEYTIPLRRPTRDGRRHHGVPRREGRRRADLLRRTLGAPRLPRPMRRAVRPAGARGIRLADG